MTVKELTEGTFRDPVGLGKKTQTDTAHFAHGIPWLPQKCLRYGPTSD